MNLKPTHCDRCGIEFPHLQRHHIKPRSQGGTDRDGIEWLCPNCHMVHHKGIGGDNPLARTPEARAKKGAASKRYWSDEEYRARQRDARARAVQHKFGVPEVGYIEGRWCSIADGCVSCGTTERKHWGYGLCGRCYQGKNWSAALRPIALRGNAQHEQVAGRILSLLAERGPTAISQEDLAAWAEVSRQTTQRCIDRLERYDQIVIDRSSEPHTYSLP